MHENEPQQFPASQTESDLSATSGTPPDWSQTESETISVLNPTRLRLTLKPMSLLRSRLGLTHLSEQVIGSQSPGEIPMSSRSASHEPSRLTPTKTAVIFWICLNPSEANVSSPASFRALKAGRVPKRSPGQSSITETIRSPSRLSYKVAIPAEMAVSPPEDSRGRDASDVMHQMLTRRLGAEVDYIVKAVDPKYHVAVGNRLEAMMAKRSLYYTRNRDGNRRVRAGACAEARVVSVIRPGIFVDIFGVETFVPLAELSYQRMMDATTAFQPGQRVLVRILRIQGQRPSEITVEASVKQAGENPYEKAVRKYSVGNRYVGTVSMVNTTGVFVALDGGIDCLCNYPRRGRPPRGARATVKILGISQDTNRIWGVITHIALPQ